MRNDDTVFSADITDELLMRALLDAVEAMGQFAIVGRSIPDAIARLDLLRQHFEKEHHT